MVTPCRSTRDVILRTPDLARARDFYHAALGLDVQEVHGTMVGMETGSFRLYVEEGPAHGPVFEFLVADVPEAKARLVAAGCTLVEEDPSVPRCYLRDPFGLVFNLGRNPR